MGKDRSTRMKEWYQERKEELAAVRKASYPVNKEKILTANRAWRKENPDYMAQYQSKRRKNDPLFKLASNLRIRLCEALQKTTWQKNTHFSEYIGCTQEELKIHIEKQFQPGMSWDNQGEWHIDHIIPLSSAKTEKEMYKLCRYDNLQPLWAEDNWSKNDNVN